MNDPESIVNKRKELSPEGQELASFLEGQVRDRKIEVPMLPDVASRVLAASYDPDSDASLLAKLIQGDQALAGHVMRIANSAAYTPNASMVSLQQAIARLGMELITEIALAASLNAKLFKAPSFEKRMSEIWDHALCSGIWGKEVARFSKKNVEASFLCGLLHSIGRPAILQDIAEYTHQHDIRVSYEEAMTLEQMFHVSYGEVIVQKWKMPIIVQESVQHYLNYIDAKNCRDQAMVVDGATKLAQVTLLKDDAFGDAEAKNTFVEGVFADIVFADLNLYEDEIELLKEQEDKVKSALEAMRL